MKFILSIICLLAFNNLDAQLLYKNLRASQEYYENVFSEYEDEFQAMSAPEEYKDESAVILKEKTHLSFLSRRAGQVCKGIVRRRILIQQASELETFTEYYYQESDIAGLKHIKPDGTVIEIDLENAIKVESEIPSYYRNGFQKQAYYKTAIPNLEVGDIIDSYKVFAEYYTSGEIELMSTISSEYPMVSFDVIVDVDDKWTFRRRAFNTDNEFVLSREQGVDKKGNQSKGVKRYILNESNLASAKYERWAYPFMTNPGIKLMGVTKASVYYDRSDKSQKKLDISEEFRGAMATNGQYVGAMMPIMKKIYKSAIKKKSDKEKPDIIYNAFKYFNAVNNTMDITEAMRFNEGDLHYLSHNYASLNDGWFSAMYSHILNKEGIKSHIAMVVPEYLGGIDAAVTSSEIEYGVYVPSVDKYYWTVDNYRAPGDEYNKVMGATGYLMPYADRSSRNPSKKSITIPYSNHKKNTNETIMTVTVNEDNSMDFDRTLKLTGLYKTDYNSFLLYHTFFGKENILDFCTSDHKEKILDYEVNGFTKKAARKMNTSLGELGQEVDEYYEIRDKNIDEWIKGDFRVDEIQDFETVSFGTSQKDNNLETKMQFTSSEYIKKAGPNLIFEIGALISPQVELSDEEINERERDAFINYEKTISNDITVTLPAGLTAHGLDALQFNVDNDYGSFVSTVIQDGQILKINTSKIYKKTLVPIANWNDLAEMLEAAYQFTQQKVILKKS